MTLKREHLREHFTWERNTVYLFLFSTRKRSRDSQNSLSPLKGRNSNLETESMSPSQPLNQIPLWAMLWEASDLVESWSISGVDKDNFLSVLSLFGQFHLGFRHSICPGIAGSGPYGLRRGLKDHVYSLIQCVFRARLPQREGARRLGGYMWIYPRNPELLHYILRVGVKFIHRLGGKPGSQDIPLSLQCLRESLERVPHQIGHTWGFLTWTSCPGVRSWLLLSPRSWRPWTLGQRSMGQSLWFHFSTKRISLSSSDNNSSLSDKEGVQEWYSWQITPNRALAFLPSWLEVPPIESKEESESWQRLACLDVEGLGLSDAWIARMSPITFEEKATSIAFPSIVERSGLDFAALSDPFVCLMP